MSKKKITSDLIDTMLFWYTVYDGNCSKVGNIVGRNRKVVRDIALKHNFATKSHLMRDKVNQHFYGVSDPAKARFLHMGLLFMDSEQKLLEEVSAYIHGKRRVNSKFRHIGDAIAVLNHVETAIINLTGERNIRGRTLEEIGKNTDTSYTLTVDKLLLELPEEDREEVKQKLIDRQRDEILEGVISKVS